MNECPNCRSLAVESREGEDHCHSCGVSWAPSRALASARDPIPAGLWDYLACGYVPKSSPTHGHGKKRAPLKRRRKCAA